MRDWCKDEMLTYTEKKEKKKKIPGREPTKHVELRLYHNRSNIIFNYRTARASNKRCWRGQLMQVRVFIEHNFLVQVFPAKFSFC